MSADARAPFGTFDPPRRFARLLALSQNAPRNAFGKQLSHLARELCLWRTPLPVDVTVEDIRLRCWLRDNTCERKFVFTPWRFDAPERRALRDALPKDGVFVDIGANIGLYTLDAALRLGDAGRIVALEPYPPAFERLDFNIAATRASREHWPRIDALPCGVSDRNESRELQIDSGNLGGGSITSGGARRSHSGATNRLTVACRTLTSILAELGVERVDALKIDIEGAEDVALIPFLENAPDALVPSCVVVENSDHLWKRDLRAAFASRGLREAFRTRLNTVFTRNGA